MRKLTVARIWAALACALSLLVAAPAAVAQDRPRVVAVNYPLQYFAQRLLGDAAEVEFPVPEGVDPSFWRPSIGDISRVQSADLILLNGAGFAAWIDRVSLPRSRVVNTTRGLDAQFIVTESITHSHGDGGEHSHEGLASYTWLDPALALTQAETVALAIVGRGLAPEGEVIAALETLRAEMTALDQTAGRLLGAGAGAPIIATHPRYQYLARRYRLEVSSLAWEAGAAPTPTELEDLANLATGTGARVLLWEAEPPAAAFAATEALGLRNVVFDPMASGPSTGSFITGFDAAVAALAEALDASPGN
ncbi:MAG: metal ABC transporter substrate-binding protein [Pseudomonadota bacterium]